jgi:hypothetical protein
MDGNNFNLRLSGGGEPATPADVEAAGASLERLAGAERVAAGPSFEDRVFMATRAAIAQGMPEDVADVAGLLDELAAMEREGSPATMEDRVVMASAAQLRAPAAGSHRPVIAVIGRVGAPAGGGALVTGRGHGVDGERPTGRHAGAADRDLMSVARSGIGAVAVGVRGPAPGPTP